MVLNKSIPPSKSNKIYFELNKSKLNGILIQYYFKNPQQMKYFIYLCICLSFVYDLR